MLHRAGLQGLIACDSIANSHVCAVIDTAGGRGCRDHGKPGAECGGNRLADAVPRFAKAGSVAMLWICASNDSCFGPALARAMAARQVSAGGRLPFHETAAFGTDGHALLFETGGSRLWGALAQSYLADDRRGAAAP